MVGIEDGEKSDVASDDAKKDIFCLSFTIPYFARIGRAISVVGYHQKDYGK